MCSTIDFVLIFLLHLAGSTFFPRQILFMVSFLWYLLMDITLIEMPY